MPEVFIKIRFFLFIFCLYASSVQAQLSGSIPIGTWRVHNPISTGSSIMVSNNSVYMASSSNFQKLNLSDNSISILSRVDGFTDVNITCIRTFNNSKDYIVAYASGIFDIVKNNVIYSNDEIIRASIVGSKRINHIYVSGNIAYFSCDFGVLVYNLDRLEIVETWKNLAPSGQSNPIYYATLNTKKDSVFLATNDGILSARLSVGVNLLDYANWTLHGSTQNAPIGKISTINEWNDTIYTATTNYGIHYYAAGKWTSLGISIDPSKTCYNLTKVNDGLVLCAENRVFHIKSANQVDYLSNLNYDMREVAQGNNCWWIANYSSGIMQYTPGKPFNYYSSTSAPTSNIIFDLYSYKNNITVISGGYDNVFATQFRYNGFWQFEKDQWKNYFYGNPYPFGYGDVITSFYNPNEDSLYFGHWGAGFLTYRLGQSVFGEHNKTNTPINSNFITGFDVDANKNVWIASWNVAVGAASLIKKNKNLYTSYVLQKNEGRYLLSMLIDDYGNKWCRYGFFGMNRSILVFNENSPYRERYFTTERGQGALPSGNVNCIVKDLNGIIWIGTNLGIAGYQNPNNAFTEDFFTPIYNGFPILFDKNVTAIKVDNANRKWVGTSDGLWLFNDDFTEALLYFDKTNSPLPSNNIVDIEIQQESGEVFIATTVGLISYRNDATESSESISNVKVFPNPVTPNYSGLVAIEGLIDQSNVKIMDLSGRLVYETKSNGGTATWPLTNYKGQRVLPGIYVVFAIDSKGNEKMAAKIAVIE